MHQASSRANILAALNQNGMSELADQVDIIIAVTFFEKGAAEQSLRDQAGLKKAHVLRCMKLFWHGPASSPLLQCDKTLPPVSNSTMSEMHHMGACLKTEVRLVGMSISLPALASSAMRVTRTIACASDLITEVPLLRWALPLTEYDLVRRRVRHAGFLERVECFDNFSFGVSPTETKAMDPCQRMLLERGYSALHSACLQRQSLLGSLTGVLIGFASHEFSEVLASSTEKHNVYAATGASASVASGRLSYVLGLHGPCVSYDTACSSGLVACHAALRGLQLAECKTGLASAVMLMLQPGVSISFAIAGMTSPRGRSHTFDARADGYARGEGCGSAAFRNRTTSTRLCGSAVRQDGRSASLTAPNGNAQRDVLLAAGFDAAITSLPQEIHDVLHEAHGTGTALGDPIESSSLDAAMEPCVRCTLGSVKANAGHGEASAGMAGMLKLVLVLQQGIVVSNTHLRSLNPHLGVAHRDNPYVLSTAASGRVAYTKHCGVSSFGYSGTIAHAVLNHVICSETQVAHSSLVYRRRTFPWREVHFLHHHHANMEMRCMLSESAQKQLDRALASASHSAIPGRVEVAIIGAGLAGLLLASVFSSACAESLALLEKSATVGGTWRHHGNAFSRVNSSEPSYRIPVGKKQHNSNHSHRGEILFDVLRLIEQHDLVRWVHTHAAIRRVAPAIDSWCLSGLRHAACAFQLRCSFTVLCTNRRLGSPRRISLAGEEVFGGAVLRGLGGDVNKLSCSGTRVVVLGMGAFAIENVRTSLEHGASHVTILCRRRGTVCPQIVDWVNFIRPFDSAFRHNSAGDAIVLRHWQALYDSSGASRPECWATEGMIKPDGHTVSTSDMFFIAHSLKMHETLLGEVVRLEPQRVVASGTHTSLLAQVIIACVGFEVNEGNERLLGRARTQAAGQVQNGLWVQIESHLDARSFNSPFGSSYLLGVGFNAQLMKRCWKKGDIVERMARAGQLPHRINSLTATQALQGIYDLLLIEPQMPVALRAHLSSAAAAFHSTMTPDEYVKENIKLWERNSELLEVSAQAGSNAKRLEFPFSRLFEQLTDLLEEGIMVEACTASTRDVAHSCMIDEVMRLANEVIGASGLDADAPLMDAGLDSLGTAELGARLQEVAGRELPATLVLEAPTPRLLASLIFAEAPTTPSYLLAVDNDQVTLVLDGSSLHLPQGSAMLDGMRYATSSACDLIQQVPGQRWEHSDASIASCSLLPKQAQALRHGGFLTDVQRFDNRAFFISLAEAMAMDPQQRLLLEYGSAALHDAGMQRAALLWAPVGAFVGMEYFDFNQMMLESVRQPNVLAANTGSMAAGRTSFALGLNGPCACICTTCSSGLVTVNIAAGALTSHECTPALSMATSLLLRPNVHIWHSLAGGLSATGRCHSYDARADGFARSEAIIAVVLGSGLGACVLASQAVRSDGRSASFTAPNGQAQQALLAAACERAGIAPMAVVSYEAHGTGTALGDPTEVRSMAATLLHTRQEMGSNLVLSCIKACIAHVEPGAGLAGLLQLACALKTRQSPPNAQLRAINQHVGVAIRGVMSAVGAQHMKLAQLDNAHGGVSAFGINGTIAHVLLRCEVQNAVYQVKQGSHRQLAYRRVTFPWQNSGSKDAPLDLSGSHSSRDIIDADTPLMQAGVTSIIVRGLSARLQVLAKLSVSPTLVFEHPTPRMIASHLTNIGCPEEIATVSAVISVIESEIERGRHHTASAKASMLLEKKTVVAPDERLQVAQVSWNQLQMLSIYSTYPASTAYSEPVLYHLAGRLSPHALHSSLTSIVLRHEVLRTTYEMDATSTFVQRVHPATAEQGLLQKHKVLSEEAAHVLVREDVTTPFELMTASGFPLRFSLIAIDSETHLLLINVHHIATDEWSLHVLSHEMGALYRLNCGDLMGGGLPELQLQYIDYSQSQIQAVSSPEYDHHRNYWRTCLCDGALPCLELPLDYSRPVTQTFPGDEVAVQIGEPVVRYLQNIAREHSCTLFQPFLALWSLLLCRHSGQTEVAIGSPYHGRDAADTEVLVGYFVNVLALYVEVPYCSTVDAMVRNTRGVARNGMLHAALPFQHILHELLPKHVRDTTRNAVFQAMATWRGEAEEKDATAALTLGQFLAVRPSESLGHRTAKVELTLFAGVGPSHVIDGAIEFNTDLFARGTIERLAARLTVLTSGFVDAQDAMDVHGLCILSLDETNCMLRKYNDTMASFLVEGCIHDLVTTQSLHHPVAVAIDWQDCTMSYAEMLETAGNIGARLLANNPVSEFALALQLFRAMEQVVGVLSALVSNGAYLPVDPTWPLDRRAFMVNDAACVHFLVQSTYRSEFDSWFGGAIVSLDNVLSMPANRMNLVTTSGAMPQHLAYIYFTSGSTGAPKGVMVSHAGVVNLLQAIRHQYSFNERTWVFGLSTNITFDPFGRKLWLCLGLLGGCVRLLQDSLALLQLHRKLAVTHLGDVPSVMAEAVVPAAVKHVEVAGEALTRACVENVGASTVLWNNYGPTEASVDVTGKLVPRKDAQQHRPASIGTPLVNVQCYIVDVHARVHSLAPLSVWGELWLGGVQVTRGYLNRQEKTAACFIANPWPTPVRSSCKVAYKTGDQVRWCPDGELEFGGRIDFQVKLRGQRLELGEIEHALRSQPGVVEAIALLAKEIDELVAYISPAAIAGTFIEHRGDFSDAVPFRKVASLQSICTILPAYMRPSLVVGVDEWPRTSSGKIDRKRLPLPLSHEGSGIIIAPRTAEEVAVLGAFAFILGLAPETISVDASFFELGGNSLRMAALARTLAETLGHQVGSADVLQWPTVASFARTSDERVALQLPSLTHFTDPTASIASFLQAIGLECHEDKFRSEGYCARKMYYVVVKNVTHTSVLCGRYHDLETLISFDESERLEILTVDLGLAPKETQACLDALSKSSP